MKNLIIVLIMLIGIILISCEEKEKTCVIVGQVIDRPQSTKLKLTKTFEDFRSQTAINIPISNGSFSYTINYKDVEAYNLAFEDELKQGRWRPITFFLTNDTIKMVLHPMEQWEKNTVIGGEDNKQFQDYEKLKMAESMEKTGAIRDRMDVLQQNDKYENQKMKDLYESLDNTNCQGEKQKIYNQINEMYQSGEGLTPEARKLNSQMDSIMELMNKKELEYITNNVSISNYYILVESIINAIDYNELFNFDQLVDLQKRYAAKFDDHTYTQYSNEILWRFNNLKPGGDFYDFTLADLNNKEYTLSEAIKDKYAVIDIWAPWCGPCISKSRELKPVYEEFKDKDFVVIGVVTKYEELNEIKERLETDLYPWVTLIDRPELDTRINQYYGTELSGGCHILVDKKGKIVSMNPTANEVRDILSANL